MRPSCAARTLVISDGAAVHDLPATREPLDRPPLALRRLGLVGKGRDRDRRPTDDEPSGLIGRLDASPRQLIPMGRIITFAVATAIGQEEIRRVGRGDDGARTRMLTIRDREAPRSKKGDDQRRGRIT